MNEPVFTYQHHAQGKEVSEGGEIINGGSIGINSILNRFVSDYSTNKKPVFDIYCVNLMTFLRNNYDKNKNDEQILYDVDKDVDLFIYYLSTYLQNEVKRSSLLFYLPEYYVLDVYRKKLSPTNEKIEALAKKLDKSIKKDELVLSNKVLDIFVKKLRNNKVSPFKVLGREISKLGKSSNDTLCLMTHVPMDLHLMKTHKKITLLESYTAALKPTTMWGAKIFKTDYLPFNLALCIALGDGMHLKPLLNRTDKKRLLEDAKKQRWMMKTESEIKRILMTNYGLPRQLIGN